MHNVDDPCDGVLLGGLYGLFGVGLALVFGLTAIFGSQRKPAIISGA